MDTKLRHQLMHQIRTSLRASVSITPERAARFFRTGPGEYAQGDQFIGVPVPSLRKIASQFPSVTLSVINELLASPINEERLLALIFLVKNYQRATDQDKEIIYRFYLNSMTQVNNWNLVDASAHLIMGAHLWPRDKNILLTLARSETLWVRRISIVATWDFIKRGECQWTYTLAELLLTDPQDLIHKASGWMLREAGKRDLNQLEAFLSRFVHSMPRTMLRYAIEKLPEKRRLYYLQIR